MFPIIVTFGRHIKIINFSGCQFGVGKIKLKAHQNTLSQFSKEKVEENSNPISENKIQKCGLSKLTFNFCCLPSKTDPCQFWSILEGLKNSCLILSLRHITAHFSGIDEYYAKDCFKKLQLDSIYMSGKVSGQRFPYFIHPKTPDRGS
ncbi:unnamed protein product [Moneuplotes crassus]|uniref:Uncharacterized protein n=1 Tax=Euplotes crassus TaxID=5936 RepID=A0AAD1UCB7_EUPCR|nr:unnamed protein product [Moneuplotes crassus]